LEIDILNEPESFNDHNDRYDTKYNWNNKINSCIESYLRSEICIDSDILDDSDYDNDSTLNNPN